MAEDGVNETDVLYELDGGIATLTLNRPRKLNTLSESVLAALQARPILYIPLSRGGDPAPMVEARATQQLLRDLLVFVGGDPANPASFREDVYNGLKARYPG